MKTVLINDTRTMVKSFDTANCIIEFTTNPTEAKSYDNEWMANAEAEYLNFHCKEHSHILKSMSGRCVHIISDDEYMLGGTRYNFNGEPSERARDYVATAASTNVTLEGQGHFTTIDAMPLYYVDTTITRAQ